MKKRTPPERKKALAVKAPKAVAKPAAPRARQSPSKMTTVNIEGFNRTESEKRPHEVSVEELYFDPRNPRLADYDHTGTQASVYKVLSKEFDIQPLMDSMYRSGYFWEEPLVVVREALPELKGKKVLVVIEGNRRLAALKSIAADEAGFPDIERRKRLSEIPVIERSTREETLAFVGFRHVTGIVPWEAAAKAQYAHGLVMQGMALNDISQLIGDKTRDISRWVRTQSLIEHAASQGLRSDDAERQFYFSYLLTSTDAPGTKTWLNVDINVRSGLVDKVDASRLRKLWYWLYGSKAAGRSPVIAESRQIHKLNQVIANGAAIRELERTSNLERALVETKKPGEYVIEILGKVRSLLQDLSAVIAGQGGLAAISDDLFLVDEGRAEFSRIEKILSETKKQLEL